MEYVKPSYEIEVIEVGDLVLASLIEMKFFDTAEGPKAEMNMDYNNLFGLK